VKEKMNADWVSLREAVLRVVETVPTLGRESRKLLEARGRVLAEDLISPIDLPLWTNSAMDGFACRSEDVRGASPDRPIRLPVMDDIPAGGFPQGALAPGTAARIMTGAPVPEGADSVVRIEHTDGGSEIGRSGARVLILNDHDAGRNLRRRGEDLARGSSALRAGSLLSAGSIGVAASVGRAELPVIRRPVVALLTSGDELVEVGDFDQVLAGRRIVSSNTYTLTAQLQEIGCEVRNLGIARDTAESLRERLEQARGCDALITSAGISVGEHDHVRSVLLELGARVEFWRVRIRPGSPFAFGTVQRLGGIPWFGLPGNPVSSMVTFELFAKPALLRMSGRDEVFPLPLRARLVDEYASTPGLAHLVRVHLARSGSGDLKAGLTGAQGSGILSSFVAADGLLMVPERHAGATRGESFDVLAFGAKLTSDCPY
jgi:molybdopterin molybdotransferase